MSRERGFTLIEILIAFAIAALALIALFRGTGAGLTAVRQAGRYEEASSRAASHLAALGWVVAMAGGEYEGDDGDGYHWRLVLRPVATSVPPNAQTPNPPPSPPAPITLYAVTVTISWSELGQSRALSLVSERIGGGANPGVTGAQNAADAN